MSKTQLPTSTPTDTQLQIQTPDEDFKIGSRVCIKSQHPLFPGEECIIVALPSLDAAIVELLSGKRERLMLKYLEPYVPYLEQTEELNKDLKSTLGMEITRENSELPPLPRHSHTTLVEVIEPLSPDEELERHRLELKVARAFYEAGAALRLLRDKRLYRTTHKTFQEYCTKRFGMTRRKGDYLISAAGIFENLEMRTNHSQILPTNLEQIKPLMTLLQADDQWSAWSDAVEDNDGKVPTGKIVKGVVERMKEKPLYLASDFCYIGDVFTLTLLEGPERKYNGYPCVAVELKHFTLDVDVYDTTLAVKPENLKKIDSPDIRRQLPAILQRIKRVRNVEMLDRGTYYVLDGLGRQTYLTDFEEKLLSFLEKEYGIESNSGK